ncbi:hypothetical protein VTN00DRAFT_9967 [Thermoascus crustaceus]|uniref:uncharacterized protein n=1 Tax=Thermoascus crustaceus TaxID=5088 RepID=UPI003741E9A0
MAAEKANSGSGLSGDEEKQRRPSSQYPKKMIFAPGDIEGPQESKTSKPSATSEPNIAPTQTPDPSATFSKTSASRLTEEPPRSDTSTPTSATESHLLSHPARAHQFVTNPPLTISQLHPTNPLRQFHKWFRDPRLPPSSAPETCTLATASMPSGRVSARVLYLKELDERGWVVYSCWGSREGKGAQVFGKGPNKDDPAAEVFGAESGPEASSSEGIEEDLQELGNRWAALTFFWPAVERQVRIEGLIEPLSREESEVYWRTRERGSQIGGWSSWQSKVLWSAEPGTLPSHQRKSQVEVQEGIHAAAHQPAASSDVQEDTGVVDIDDGRSVLENRVKEMEARFAGTEEIPLPPFWGGVRIVPESVEFWQGRRSRLHDRFRYVRVHADEKGEKDAEEGLFKWRIERLSP